MGHTGEYLHSCEPLQCRKRNGVCKKVIIVRAESLKGREEYKLVVGWGCPPSKAVAHIPEDRRGPGYGSRCRWLAKYGDGQVIGRNMLDFQ